MDKIRIIKTLALILGLSAFAIAMQGCAGNRALSPTGKYDGDKALYEFDGALLAYAETTEELVDLAERHPVAVENIEGLADFIADLRRNRLRLINEAGSLRRDYLAGKALVGELRGSEAGFKIAVEAARAYLLRVASDDSARIDLVEPGVLTRTWSFDQDLEFFNESRKAAI